MIGARARYDKVKPTSRVLALTTEAKGLQGAINAVAQGVADEARDVIQSVQPRDVLEGKALTRYADTLDPVDAGQDFPRAKFMAGTPIRVALIAPEDGAWSASFIEFGRGSRPGLYALTRTAARWKRTYHA